MILYPRGPGNLAQHMDWWTAFVKTLVHSLLSILFDFLKVEND